MDETNLFKCFLYCLLDDEMFSSGSFCRKIGSFDGAMIDTVSTLIIKNPAAEFDKK